MEPKDIKADSIQTVVCEVMEKLKPIPMDEDTTRLMLSFLLDKSSKERSVELFGKIWQAQVMAKRMKVQFGRDMDPRCAILIAMWAQSVGSCVLYMYYCQYMCNKMKIEGELTLDIMCEKIFPWGFFQDTDIHKVWDSQKVNNRAENFKDIDLGNSGDNMVDYGLAAESLMVTEAA